MAFTEGQRAFIREVAFEVGKELKAGILETVDVKIERHTTLCPAGAKVKKATWILIGIGLAAAGGGTGLGFLLTSAAAAAHAVK
jgi:hypothetical protein